MTAPPPLQLSVYVHDELGLSLDLPEAAWPPPAHAIQPGPAFDLLTAMPGQLGDPRRLAYWLEAFLPEHGARGLLGQQAAFELQQHGYGDPPNHVGALLWAAAEAEYTGAVSFLRTGRGTEHETPPERLPAPKPVYTFLPDAAVALQLQRAAIIATGGRARADDAGNERRASLAGMRAKLSLTKFTEGHWRAAMGRALNTWIVKHEHNPTLPGEAGVEAICQRTLQILGVEAADTCARVFDGTQAVLSERTDRWHDENGAVQPRHQEEFIQALAMNPSHKYDTGSREEPRWGEAHRLLTRHASDPGRQHRKLVWALAATWMLGHCDLHRRNLGFRHALPGEPRDLTLAPLYDVSTPFGTEYENRLAVAIDGKRRLHLITPRTWIRHGEAAGIDAGIALEIVRSVAKQLPDAIQTARQQARSGDENLLQADVDSRIEATVSQLEKRAREFTQLAEGLVRKRARTQKPGG